MHKMDGLQLQAMRTAARQIVLVSKTVKRAPAQLRTAVGDSAGPDSGRAARLSLRGLVVACFRHLG
jgi:hypothetical protein